ncbi:MAG: ABC transporter substrate-binding protein [Comamonadaceae bacterium]|jgi:branched-chain amino acid transport system substrate-binding protein|uniref:Branched-chain amino acid ABC transporter substrate-binding protein n=1 Tax=Hydrogenophaga borbori TaxID=2294117 RepID=A0A372EPR0_9BURK|nr:MULTISPECIES: ABC transporter substrate-binding protein [Hydrogenophaga]NCT95868.1 ABC transporter substrate-binding protein [Comamonadaceae bacterium]RFP82585.1 branched-chain amino acid ABC transporter substrate-binding protein [Hydrogenophaga borbori]WQB82166.1 ABC transporter substrate-binding protein [Hydrogenophaga sp. SNF1]
MKQLLKTTLATAVAATLASAAWADLTVGVSVPLTGPASGLGIPMANGVKMWPATVGGEKVNVIILDDATDPTKGVQNARRFVNQDKVDVIVGSGATPVAIPMADVATESGTPHLALSPIGLPPGKDAWSFRMPQSNGVMAEAMVEHMKKQGVKSVGFLGYTDAYGEQWLQALTPLLEKAGIKLSGVERFARSDTTVTGQALKLASANPDAMVVVASGSGAAMPQLGLIERGYKGKFYQTHAAATRDLMRVGGKAVEGTFVTTGPVVVAEQLPDSHPSKALGVKFNAEYEKIYGAGTRNQFGAHSYDAYLLLDKLVPVAAKKGKPGTPEFRAALKAALEDAPAMPVTHGIIDFTATDHWGFKTGSGVVMKVVNGDWKLEQ